MIIVEVSGGLGNQLYKYATAYAASRESGQSITIDRTIIDKVDFRDYELDGLCIEYAKEIVWDYQTGAVDRLLWNKAKRFFAVRGAKMMTETRGVCQYYPEITELAKRGKSLYLNGGWQNYHHFEQYKEDLVRMCDIRFTIGKKATALLCAIQSKNSVAVHVRRGDYVKLGFTIEDEYYRRALSALPEGLTEAHFFVFSDDMEYCRELFRDIPPRQITYVTHDEPRAGLTDFYLMRHCKHIVMANSSFSWWAAYTMKEKNARVICPDGGEKDPIRNSLYPAGWMIV